MFKFMTVTTLLLAAAFFELSGGFEFEPRGAEASAAAQQLFARRPAGTDPDTTQAASLSESTPSASPSDLIAAKSAPAADGSAKVTQAAFETNDAAHAIDPSVSGLPLARVTQAQVTQAQVTQATTPQDTATPALSGTGVEKPNLSQAERQALADAVTRDDPLARGADIREVAGNYVNMRQGPGTRFGVIDQLSQGDTVEVIDRKGSWLKLRVEATGATGWMADFLVTAAAD